MDTSLNNHSRQSYITQKGKAVTPRENTHSDRQFNDFFQQTALTLADIFMDKRSSTDGDILHPAPSGNNYRAYSPIYGMNVAPPETDI
jgi:hypothetical protein